jgi:hypothetical protein
MEITPKEIKDLRRQESDEGKKEEAKEYKARRDHDSELGWANFIARHSGAQAIANNDVYHSCEANHGLMTEFIETHNLHVDANGVNLEQAFKDCRGRLAEYQGEKEYIRRTNSQTSRIMDQIPSPSFPRPRPPFTRSQLVEMGNTARGRDKLRSANKRYGVDAINSILAGN